MFYSTDPDFIVAVRKRFNTSVFSMLSILPTIRACTMKTFYGRN